MHKYLRSIGFSKLEDRKELQKLLTDIVVNGTERAYTSNGDKSLLAQFSKDFAENMGIAVCGEFDEDDKFTYDYYYPFLRGNIISSREDISVERHAAQESYAGVCDEMKVGVSLIFYLQNMIPYVKAKNSGLLPIKGTTVTLTALASKGNIMMPIKKTEKDLIRNKKTAISRRIQKEDVFSLVDTYFMPYGVECDQYSVLGEIMDFQLVKNRMTDEEIYIMTLVCNDLVFEMCINKEDLYGEPKVGRRFKGMIWMQGFINFPDE